MRDRVRRARGAGPADRAAATAPAAGEPDSGAPPAPADEGRQECPDCGREFAVNKDGTLRKHTCTVDASAPQVTFDAGGEV